MGHCIYSLSSGIWKLFLVLIASDKIKHPTSGKYSELRDCNYCNSVAFQCFVDVRGTRVCVHSILTTSYSKKE